MQTVTVAGISYSYQVFPRTFYGGIVIKNEVPQYVGSDSIFAQYGNQCVKDVSLGVDNTLWALSCEKKGDDYKIIKWDPFTNAWYDVPGMQGVAIAAWNEISAAVVTSAGAIYVSSKQETRPNYLPPSEIPVTNSSTFF